MHFSPIMIYLVVLNGQSWVRSLMQARSYQALEFEAESIYKTISFSHSTEKSLSHWQDEPGSGTSLAWEKRAKSKSGVILGTNSLPGIQVTIVAIRHGGFLLCHNIKHRLCMNNASFRHPCKLWTILLPKIVVGHDLGPCFLHHCLSPGSLTLKLWSQKTGMRMLPKKLRTLRQKSQKDGSTMSPQKSLTQVALPSIFSDLDCSNQEKTSMA